MSARAPAPLVLEWSPKALLGYDAGTKSTRSFASFAEAASVSREAVVALSRRSVFLRVLRVPDVAPDEIRQILNLRLADLFPVATSDLAIDFQLTDDVTVEGRLAMVAAIPTVELARIYQELRNAGIRPVRVVPAALASTLIEATGTEPAAVVQETPEGIGIDVVAGGIVRQSRVTNLPQQLQAEVCRTFGLAGLECGTIVSAGGLALPFSEVVVKENGLALLQHYQDRLFINLELPEEVAAKRRRTKTQRQRLALLLMGAAAALGLYVFFDFNDGAVAMRQTEARNKVILDKMKSEQKGLEATLATIATQNSGLERAYRPPQRLSDVMLLLSNRTPAGVWLTGMTMERGKSLSVRGTATSNESLTTYLKTLSSDPRLRDVRLVFANNAAIEETPVVQFSISAFPVGNLPLQEASKEKKR